MKRRPKTKTAPKPDPTKPLRTEAEPYLAGDQAFGIALYSARMMVSHITAEDVIRKHLTDLGFKKLPAVFIPRSN